MTIRRVVPDLKTEDLEAARNFYTELLGFRVGMDMGSLVTLVSPSNPTAQITLQEAGEPELTIEVEDVDRVYEAALQQRADVVYPLTDEEWGVRRFFVRAPDGRVINVMMHRVEEV